jgi:hypothetical protein
MGRETCSEFIENQSKMKLHQYLIDKKLIYDKIECILFYRYETNYFWKIRVGYELEVFKQSV